MTDTKKQLKKSADDSLDKSDYVTKAIENCNSVIEKLKCNSEIDIIASSKSNKKIEEKHSIAIVRNEKVSFPNNYIDILKGERSKKSDEKLKNTVDINKPIKRKVTRLKFDTLKPASVNNSEVPFKIADVYSLNEHMNDDEDITIANSKKRKATDCEDINENVKRKRGRPPKAEKNRIQVEVTPIIEKEIEAINRKTKGRPRGKFGPKDTNHSKLVDTIFDQINTSKVDTTITESTDDSSALKTTTNVDISTADVSNSGTVTCAVCNAQILKSSWTYHKYRSHNNLAWRIGDEPLNLTDNALVMKILTELYKRKKPLYCEICNQVKKSVLGYLSHKSICQKSPGEIQATKITCVHCGRILMPVSMEIHLKMCKGIEANREVKIPTTPLEDVPITSKRRAATKANNFLKEFKDTDVKNESIEEEEEEVIEPVKKTRVTWYTDFDFRPTPKGRMHIKAEINNNGIAICWFEVCNFESTDIEEMVLHISKCKYKPLQGYTCKFCFVIYTNKDEIVRHSEQNHTKVKKDEEFDETAEELFREDTDSFDHFLNNFKGKNVIQQPLRKNVLNGIYFLIRYRLAPNSAPLIYPPSYGWCYNFYVYNFSLSELYPHWRSTFDSFIKVDSKMLSKYLPTQKYSVCTASIQEKTYTDPLTLDYVWKRYMLFESDLLHSDTSTIFCGGAITAMAWLPTPYNEENNAQMLAVCCNSNFNKGYPIHQLYKESGLIQFWNCGILKNSDTITERPVLQFCLAHDHGPVWCLEWCPSGCFDKEITLHSPQRLGILAAGSADSFVYIYSICVPHCKNGKIFKLKPMLKLVQSLKRELTVNGIEPHVTKLSWTKAKKHSYLAVGYSDGMIAIFDLNTTSPLLNSLSDNDIKTMLPCQILPAHFHAVTALHLYHLNDGRRWLMSGSLDRTIKYWDLENPLIPVSNFTKIIVTDGTWLSYWISSVHSYEDCCGGGLTASTVHQLRNYECDGSSILHSNSHVSSITGSEWTNSFLQGNVAGEIAAFFPHQLFYYLDNDKTFRLKRGILGYARVIQKDLSLAERIASEKEKLDNLKQASPGKNVNIHKFKKENKHKEPTNYEEANEKYGLVFCDLIIDSLKDFPSNFSSYCKSNSEKFYPTTPHIYPLQAINQITFNPNSNSYCHYATGYQAGFVRISSIKNINKNSSNMYAAVKLKTASP